MNFSNERALTAPLILLGIYKHQTREYAKQDEIDSIPTTKSKQAKEISKIKTN
jgi:hypothetical protein